jgi:outer membrane biosynthesis protein TonB
MLARKTWPCQTCAVAATPSLNAVRLSLSNSSSVSGNERVIAMWPAEKVEQPPKPQPPEHPHPPPPLHPQQPAPQPAEEVAQPVPQPAPHAEQPPQASVLHSAPQPVPQPAPHAEQPPQASVLHSDSAPHSARSVLVACFLAGCTSVSTAGTFSDEVSILRIGPASAAVCAGNTRRLR